jgi:membrane protein DedA with SNARE-associated domain
MVIGKYRVRQIIEALAACFAFIALQTLLLVVPSPPHDVLALAVGTLDSRSPPQLPYRFIAALVVYLSALFDASTFLWFKPPKTHIEP